jgi:hypothetical protein
LERDLKEEAIQRVMELVSPARQREECARQVRFAVGLIALPMPDLLSAGKIKQHLQKLSVALFEARAAITGSPEGLNYSIFGEMSRDVFVHQLSQTEYASGRSAEQLNVKRSGGVPSARTDAKRARIAASCAFDLLNDWGGLVPTLTKSGHYFQLASLLFELATGRQEKDVSRSCADYIKRLRNDGFPSARELTRKRNALKHAPPPPAHILKASKKRNSKK